MRSISHTHHPRRQHRRHFRASVAASLAGCALTGCIIAAARPAQAQIETVGFPLINRAFDGDQASGVEVIVNQTFTGPGTLTSWSFFNNNPNLALPITPFLAQQTASASFVITGIGTTRTNAGTGTQTFDFGLTSGSNAVASNIVFGFHSGTTTTGTIGVVELDGGQPANPIFLYFSDNIAVNQTRSGTSSFNDRFYSVQATATLASTAAAPEPGTVALVGMGIFPLLGIAAAARRRRL